MKDEQEIKIKYKNISEYFPWRRYFARGIDTAIYNWLMFMFFYIEQDGNIFIKFILSSILLLLVEPILISLFGTTIGKKIFGIYVLEKNTQEKIKYKEALKRTGYVFVSGMGCNIPFFDVYRYWENYSEYSNKHSEFVWEYNSNSKAILVHKKNIKIIVLSIILFAIIISSSTAKILWSKMPVNRGNIIIDDFVENYNTLLEKNYDFWYIYALDYRDDYRNQQSSKGSIVILYDIKRPTYTYIEEDGFMVGLKIFEEYDGEEKYPDVSKVDIIYSLISFVKAQEDYNFILNNNELVRIGKRIYDAPYVSFEYSMSGVKIIYEVKLEGYTVDNFGKIYIVDEDNIYYSVNFEMIKE